MEKIFGLPATELAFGMAIVLICILVLVAIGANRRFILFKMGGRSIPRRKGQSFLIVVGLMLSSAIIATSLGIGDTVRHSVRSVALDFLGPTDEIIEGPGRQLYGEEYFPYSQFTRLEQVVENNNEIEHLMPLIEIRLPASNETSGLAESSMRIRGIDEKYSDAFDELRDQDNSLVRIEDLGSKEVYLNNTAAKVLNIGAGNQITIYTQSGGSDFKVVNILRNGGLAGGGGNPFVLFALPELQKLLGKEDHLTAIYVSNKGSGEKSLELSDSVTNFLRSQLVDPDVASSIFSTLGSNDIPSILQKESELSKEDDRDLSESLQSLALNLRDESYNDNFIEEITEYQTQLALLGILEKSGLQAEAIKLTSSLPELTILEVEDTKNQRVRLAELVATGVTTIFSIFGSFSIMVGMLLIFLVFVLLAAARSTELGMARAVGLKRRDLIQLFTYEGTIYAFLAAIVGTAIGVGLSFGLVFILQDLIDSDDFTITPYYSIVSLVISFSSGLILTFITVVFSAYRASNLNIVVAIRGLKDEFVKKAPDTFKRRIVNMIWDLIFPIKQLWNIFKGNGGRVRNFLVLLIFPLSWPLCFIISLFKLFGRHSYLLLGILFLFLFVIGIANGTGASFAIGLTGMALALGLFVRFLSSKFTNDSETVNQVAGTLEGGLVLLCNSLPFDIFEGWLGEFSEPGPWFWPIGGAVSTAAAVWLLMSNTRILIGILNLILSRFSGLKAVSKTAVSYPMAAKFRTGLTVAMFALIIFTLMIFSVLNGIDNVTSKEPERVTGGYDIKATISQELPIKGYINDYLDGYNFSVVTSSSSVPTEVREISGENNTYKEAKLVSLGDKFIKSTEWRMTHYDSTYGNNDREIWEAVLKNPQLIIANATIIPSGDPFGPPDRSFKTSYISSGDDMEMGAFEIEVRKQRSDAKPNKLIVIGVIERLASGTGFTAQSATFYAKSGLASEIAQTDVPEDTYYFKLNGGESASDYAQKLERTFLSNGMNAVSLIDELEQERATGNAFNKLFQGFSGLGLVVGVAAIGVLSVRAVVERRQSIGVLRAIGFRSSMIRAQFLIESSFITFLGIFVGICLGILQSWLIYLEISKELEGAEFVIPFLEVGALIAITMVASLVASVIPANEASKTYPAEALRYE